MNVLCFAKIMTEIKATLRETTANEDVVYLLFDAIVSPLELTNKDGNPLEIDKAVASGLINRKRNVPTQIKNSASSKKVIESIYDYFEKSVLPRLASDRESDLLEILKTCIERDNSIAPDTKNSFLEKGNKDTLAEFLADVFLYSLKKENKIDVMSPDGGKQNTDPPSEISPNQNTYSAQPPILLSPTDEIEEHEITYVRELMAAYGDAEGDDDFTRDKLPQFPAYESNFARQRKDYFAAESVRRCVRDTYTVNDPDQFEILKDETYDGVVDVLEQDFDNGYQRLKGVMAQASQIRVDKCLLSRDTTWIGNSEKKGVCHVLVNERRIKGWVKKDEQDI